MALLLLGGCQEDFFGFESEFVEFFDLVFDFFVEFEGCFVFDDSLGEVEREGLFVFLFFGSLNAFFKVAPFFQGGDALGAGLFELLQEGFVDEGDAEGFRWFFPR